MSEEQEPALVSAMQRRIEWRKARNELRDRFAMAALTGLLAYPSDCQGTSKNPLKRFSKRA